MDLVFDYGYNELIQDYSLLIYESKYMKKFFKEKLETMRDEDVKYNDCIVIINNIFK